MQLYNTMSEVKYRLCFEEKETENIEKALKGDLNIQNEQLCYFLENLLPKCYEQFKNKRGMITEINPNVGYMCATILLQDIDIAFKKPEEEINFFNVTKVSFADKESFENWKKDKNYKYKIKKSDGEKYEVVIYSMDVQDELNLLLISAFIEKKYNIFEYMFENVANSIKEKFNIFNKI